jgi:hypothetical protein
MAVHTSDSRSPHIVNDDSPRKALFTSSERKRVRSRNHLFSADRIAIGRSAEVRVGYSRRIRLVFRTDLEHRPSSRYADAKPLAGVAPRPDLLSRGVTLHPGNRATEALDERPDLI